MSLSAEEKQRIYEEEKVRAEARSMAEKEARENVKERLAIGGSGSVELLDGKVRITRNLIVSTLRGFPLEKDIPLELIDSIQVEDDFFRIIAKGENDGRKTVSQDENAVLIAKPQRVAFEKLRDVIHSKIGMVEKIDTGTSESDAEIAMPTIEIGKANNRQRLKWFHWLLIAFGGLIGIFILLLGLVIAIGFAVGHKQQMQRYEPPAAAATGTVAVNPETGGLSSAIANHASEQRSTRPWYEGGTLSRSTMAEWKRASYRNRLATASDFLAALWIEGELNAEIGSMDDLKPLAVELEKQLSSVSSGGNQADSQSVSTMAAGCIILMHLKK
ncbi:hypothetical protein D3C72_175760 [compost metagenome]